MKRKQLFLLEMIAGVLLFVIAAVVMVPKFLNSQNLNHPAVFPDQWFRQKITGILHLKPDERFSRSDLLKIKELEISNISDVTGIKMFRNLERLSITHSSMQKLRLPTLVHLVELNCNDNKLDSIDISRCENLEVLNISGNALTEYVVSGVPKLRELNCSNNLLKKLDLSALSNLEWLDCSNNLLETVNTSKNQLLDTIYCSMNMISKLDLSKNPRLTKLTGWENPIITLDVSHNTLLKVFNMSRCGLSEIDFTHNKELEVIVLSDNSLVDVPNIPNIGKLRMMYIDRNDLGEDDGDEVWKLFNQVSTFEYNPQKSELPERWAQPEPGIYGGVRDDN